ncbi:hypothetical protein NDR87_13720 [Nocardia sp. CDC159]|uniref:Uncharacterized protein n=1 Tax=Nocardia pulmonis TaxID=2951408 RepID=A0A9X2IXD2_9NOCA|nr:MULTISPECIES: hypothetical protein [Nocardia]MCM6774519.1 hypothetical protein [Nocardia pulmonis]MCM6787415.1 hypothetical protein [Nocardia sp. CDC159]
MPWVTRVSAEGPTWARIDAARLLRCQAEWICQVCGELLPRRAWVILTPDSYILGDAAMHATCLTIAHRWCPYLDRHRFDAVETDFSAIYADDRRLDTIAEYGEEIRLWSL